MTTEQNLIIAKAKVDEAMREACIERGDDEMPEVDIDGPFSLVAPVAQVQLLIAAAVPA